VLRRGRESARYPDESQQRDCDGAAEVALTVTTPIAKITEAREDTKNNKCDFVFFVAS
jgi:hypothetical protein